VNPGDCPCSLNALSAYAPLVVSLASLQVSATSVSVYELVPYSIIFSEGTKWFNYSAATDVRPSNFS